MKGTVIIPRQGRDFEVAHRFETGEHHLEVSIGSSFNELYWDETAKALALSPWRHRELRKVLADHDAGWLVDYLPQLARSGDEVTFEDLKAMARVEG